MGRKNQNKRDITRSVFVEQLGLKELYRLYDLYIKYIYIYIYIYIDIIISSNWWNYDVHDIHILIKIIKHESKKKYKNK